MPNPQQLKENRYKVKMNYKITRYRNWNGDFNGGIFFADVVVIGFLIVITLFILTNTQ
jgi:hypothetical protein